MCPLEGRVQREHSAGGAYCGLADGRRVIQFHYRGAGISNDCVVITLEAPSSEGTVYDFKELSPLDFEELVRDLLQLHLELHLESFGPGRDQGIDCRHSTGADRIIVQAKHYIRTGSSGLVSALRGENQKIKALKPSRYIIATSVSLTPGIKDEIIRAMPDANLTSDDILGQEDLNNLLTKFPQVERAHFKLWLASTTVLERILHSGIYNRTETEMGLIKEMVPKFVQNDSVKDAEAILKKTGALIISGHPGVGKTTLARILVWLHASQDWKIFVVDDISEAFDISNAGEKRLIFFDDFLGQVRLSSDHVRGIDQRLPPFLQRVKANKELRFILTTRQYILSQAELLSRRLATKDMSSLRYVLNVGIYTREVRAKILYNHIFFSNLQTHQVDEILSDNFFLKIIDHKNFNPRLIELLTSEDYAQLTGEGLRSAIQRVLDNPDELWERPYRDHITNDGKALMWAMLLFPNAAGISELRSSFARAATAAGRPVPPAELQSRFASTLKELEGSVLAIVDQHVRFSNPGVRDFLQVVFLKDELWPSLLENAATLREVRQCWTIFSDRKPKPSPVATEAFLWLSALRRIEVEGAADPLRALELVLDLYEHYSDSDFLPVARQLAERVAEEGLDTSDVSDASLMLQNTILSSAPSSDLDFFQSKLTEAVASILINHGSELTFQDLEALDSAIFDYGSDPALAEEAVRIALDNYIPEIDTEMDDFSSTSELDDFESALTDLIQRRGYSGISPDSDLKYKREYLEEKESQHYDSENYRGGYAGPTPPVGSSDQSIRSMFSDLRNSR